MGYLQYGSLCGYQLQEILNYSSLGNPGPAVGISQCICCSLFTAWLLMLYFCHLLFTEDHVFLILHKTANVPGLCPEKLRIYDQKDVDSSALKCSCYITEQPAEKLTDHPSPLQVKKPMTTQKALIHFFPNLFVTIKP